MITITSAQLNALITGFLWPLTRILGLIAMAPLFGNRSVPARTKVALGVLIAAIVAPSIPGVPTIDAMSLPGVLILGQQMIIGLAMGFAMRVVFSAIELAGELTGMTMGLGFAAFFDPQTQARTSAISQFLSLVGIMLFLATNVHLMLLAVLVESFTTLPISADPLGTQGIYRLILWCGCIFSTGAQLALPMIAALLITNLALGILTRAAPQLNIYSIGFPVTLSVGFVVIMLALPYMLPVVEHLFTDGLAVMRQIGSAPPLPAVR